MPGDRKLGKKGMKWISAEVDGFEGKKSLRFKDHWKRPTGSSGLIVFRPQRPIKHEVGDRYATPFWPWPEPWQEWNECRSKW
jgi:hypothetical protein